ncbi:MAG: prepilin-type N-terminal cleavage/methylation domain-containing protein [Lachnospiraceae bacterium]|nr:prepilin-type N-terminal cleavage/methylation domain-containing protein [Lachnospiraceae bacterium]
MKLLKKLRQDNKGLSLVELIIALAIFAIAGLAIYGFVSFSTRTFTESNRNVKLQYEQQIVVNRIKDIILETSRGISFNDTDKRMLVFSDPPTGPSPDYMKVSLIKWDESTNELYYGYNDNQSIKKDDDSIIKLPEITGFSNDALLSTDVTDFSVDLSKIDTGKVYFSITFKVGNKEMSANPVVSLRNMIDKYDDDTDFEDEYSEVVIPIYSHIAKVEISRDGKIFAQNKVDTIAMAGNTTSAVYTAIVTPKKDYVGKVDISATWEIDLSTVKEGYEECISISTGADGSGNTTCTVTLKKTATKSPNDYLKNGYLTLIASSNEDNSKSARLRIKVTADGVYPESITSSDYDKYVMDVEHGQIRYKISHVIKYTGNIEDPLHPGTFVNQLSGDSAYTKITYKVTDIIYNGSDPSKALLTMPGGAGFTSTDTVDGVFIATKSMEEHTFKIHVSVNQRGKDGQEVYDDFEITIPKDIIPEPEDVTKPVIRADDRALRAGIFDMTAEWSSGVPQFESNDHSTQRYYYWLEWEIDNNDNSCGNWGNDQKNKFIDLLYFTQLNSNPSDGSEPAAATGPTTQGSDDYKKVFTDITYDWTASKSRQARVYIRHYLDWEKPFTFRVKLRAKISKTNSVWDAKYYMLPGTDPDHPDSIEASGIDQAYFDTVVVTIDPVTLRLTPAVITKANGQTEPVVFYNNKKPIYAVFNNSHTIGYGRSATKPSDSYLYDNCNSDYDAYSKGYYKIFEPEFEGLNVTTFNVNKVGKLVLKLNTKNGKSALQSYRTVNGKTVYKEEVGTTTDQWGNVQYTQGATFAEAVNTSIVKTVNGQEVYTNKLYFYIQLYPYIWKDANQFPDGCVWTCQYADVTNSNTYRNYVNGTFTDTNQTVSNYTTKPQYGEFANQ